MPDHFDLLIGIDWLNAQRFGPEIEVGANSLVIGDPRGVSRRRWWPGRRPRGRGPDQGAGQGDPDGRPNMIALGIACRLLGLRADALASLIEKRLADKGTAAIAASRAASKPDTRLPRGLLSTCTSRHTQDRLPMAHLWQRGGRARRIARRRALAAAYPITPATEILEWLAPNLVSLGGTLLQAEDELAAINMIIGASFGGTPALTATSGPGLSLMIEALGLATAASPVVVIDVMRGGPSTGIPTKSEQADLNIAIYGCHGDAPHLVLAPQSVGDCLFTTSGRPIWPRRCRRRRSCSRTSSSGRRARHRAAGRRGFHRAAIAGRRHRRGVQALRDRGGRRFADGAAWNPRRPVHRRRSHPHRARNSHQRRSRSSRPARQRRDKLEQFNYGDHWATIEATATSP